VSIHGEVPSDVVTGSFSTMEFERLPSLGERSAVNGDMGTDASKLDEKEQLRMESKNRVRKWVQDIPDFRNYGPHELAESPSFLSQDGTDPHPSSRDVLHEPCTVDSKVGCFKTFSCFSLRRKK
jgi:hypothetical protein